MARLVLRPCAMRRASYALGFVVLLIGCGPNGGPIDEELVDAELPADEEGKADSALLVDLTIAVNAQGEATSMKEKKTRPFPGAPTPLVDFACGTRFATGAVSRVECKRGTATVEVLYRAANKTAVAIYRPQGRSTDSRRFFKCTTTSTRQPLPTSLRCKSASVTQGGTGGLTSPIPSSIAAIPIRNAHWVDANKSLMRSMAPRATAEYAALQAASIEAVLIFKKPTGNGTDVSGELTTLRGLGFVEEALGHVDFPWKDFPDFSTPCKQTLEALRFIRDQLTAGRKTLFHCTVGEDRTGYLAGLWRLLVGGETDVQKVFHHEMCEHGYSMGNPLKPLAVTSQIEADLTPLFRKMVFKIRQGTLTTALEAAACQTDPGSSAAFLADTAIAPAALRCGTATTFAP